MAAETQYTANTGMVKISTANSNLDGTGTLGTVLTAGANGTFVKTVTIKSTAAVSQGMVRLFISDGTTTRLLREVDIPITTPSAVEESFEINIKLNYALKAGYVLKASTQLANNFNVIAEGLDFTYYSTSVRPESTNYTGNTGISLVNSANSALDGSGTSGTTIITALTAGSSATFKGCTISSINIKATGTVTSGMVRIFVQNTGTGTANTFLLTEISIPNITPSSTSKSLHRQIVFPEKFQLQAGYKILASTQNSEPFAVTIDGMDWKYPS